MRDLQRLLRPRSIALFGSAWAENVARQLEKNGFTGQVFGVHPSRKNMGSVACVPRIADLPEVPDVAFLGVNRQATIELVEELSKAGVGGAICFASGYEESDLSDGQALQQSLLAAAGPMPILGPNCYGVINYLDNIALWPDEHGGAQVARGVGIVAQSSNIAINMTMQRRGLSIAYMVTLGNQAQTTVADVIEALSQDHRVSCIGLYLEGFGDLSEFCRAIEYAKQLGKSVVALKIGKSEKAKYATKTHTASLSGSSDAASALLAKLGVIEVDNITVFLETLKLLDRFGPLNSNHVASVSCSGGEASLVSDLSKDTQLQFDDFSQSTVAALSDVLGPRVTIANPLDYHTYIWGDVPKMIDCFYAVLAEQTALTLFILDIPRHDRCDPRGHDCAIEAICAASKRAQHKGLSVKAAVISTLPENLTEEHIECFAAAGVITLHGLETAISAIDAIIQPPMISTHAIKTTPPKIVASGVPTRSQLLSEHESKVELANYNVPTPKQFVCKTIGELVSRADSIPQPWVLKGMGIAHKTEQGAVVLNLQSIEALEQAAHTIKNAEGFLLEEQIEPAVLELLVGVQRDPIGCLLLTLGAGGVMTELLRDTQFLLLPVSRDEVKDALKRLRCAPLLQGFRGRPQAPIERVVDAILGVVEFAIAHSEKLQSLDVNPLIVTATRAVAADALIEFQTQ